MAIRPKKRMILLGGLFLVVAVGCFVVGMILPEARTPELTARNTSLMWQIGGGFAGVGVVFLLIAAFKKPDREAFPSERPEL